MASLAPVGAVIEKIEFSAVGNADFNRRLADFDRSEMVICGIEAQVCVLRTALDFAARGVDRSLGRDAATSRRPESAAAFDRAARNGVELVTTEMVDFEWMRRANTPAFRQLSS